MILTHLKTFVFTYAAFAFIATVLLEGGAISIWPFTFGLGLVMCFVLADIIRASSYKTEAISFQGLWRLGVLFQLLIQMALLHGLPFRLGLLVLSGMVMVVLYFIFKKTADPYPLQWLNGILFVVTNLLYSNLA